MAQRMLIDASAPGETRVALVDGNQLIDYDFEDASRRQVKSSIFLAQVTRVEPSLQAAFLEYGALRQGFLALPEIHPDYYKIPVADREKLNAALKQTAADVQAEIESMEANGTALTPEALAEEFPPESEMGMDPNALQPEFTPIAGQELAPESSDSTDPMALLSSVGRTDLVLALSEALGPSQPDDYMPVQSFYSPAEQPIDGQEPENMSTTPDQNGDAAQTEGSQNRGHRGRFRGRERDMDPEALEAYRRRQLLRSYKIQEVIKRRQVMLVQVNKEERGTKGAALTTYISLPGRYCVLMPNSPNAGGVSRKITNPADRRRMKDLIATLKLPEGMGVILRTAGLECSPDELARDLDYLLRLWDSIRELTLKSTAPALIYEEGDLITRALRDLYHDDIAEVIVSGTKGYEAARDFMQMLLPDQVEKIKLYDSRQPLFSRYRVDDQIDAVHEPVVQLPSGGYLVINQTEALVAIDVNSGRSTRERNIEETAYRTNLEAASEVARQLRLRDLAGLIVVDFIDMEDYRHRIGIERRMRDALKPDRARTQVARISMFGLLELSRQRLRPSVVEAHFTRCEACGGTGWVRSDASSARAVLRAMEQELSKGSLERLTVHVHSKLALLLLNQFRLQVIELEERTHSNIVIESDDSLLPPNYRMDKMRGSRPLPAPTVNSDNAPLEASDYSTAAYSAPVADTAAAPEEHNHDHGRRRYRGRPQNDAPAQTSENANAPVDSENFAAEPSAEQNVPPRGERSRRGRGRGRDRRPNRYNDNQQNGGQTMSAGAEQPSVAPGSFTHPKQNEWSAQRVPSAVSSEQPNGFHTAPVAPSPVPQPVPAAVESSAPKNITTEPVVTRVTPEGEAKADGEGRKGWWNKLMGT